MIKWPSVAVVLIASLVLSRYSGAEIITTSEDQKSLSLTIYNNDLALVRDKRIVSLPKGEGVLAYKEISSAIKPETALFSGNDIEVIEQNFEFDLLTPRSLLNKYVGRSITLLRQNEVSGEQIRLQAKVLSTADGIVLRIGDSIETEIDGRIIYPDVPANLRDRPTLTMVVSSQNGGKQELELSYLTSGLTWEADYVALLAEDEKKLDLKGWVTLTNRSGTQYKNAKLQLVAGDVNRVIARPVALEMAAPDVARSGNAMARKRVQQESLFEYHLYTVERLTNIMDKQSKQIALLQENNGLCKKELILRSNNSGHYWAKVGEIEKGQGADVYLKLKNDKASNFGLPKPAGIVRVYKKDRSGFSQFIGEDRIEHTPENEEISIKLGQSFDITFDKKQMDFSQIRSMDKRRITESTYEITVKNAKSELADVTVEEKIPGEWQILKESSTHKKSSSDTITWELSVPAKAKTILTYRVRTVL